LHGRWVKVRAAKLTFVKDFFGRTETFRNKKKLTSYMIPIRKFALGVGIASGALLTAWLLTGDRKQRTRQYIVRRGETIRKALKPAKKEFDDSEAHYI
jgi:hypothetical protein